MPNKTILSKANAHINKYACCNCGIGWVHSLMYYNNHIELYVDKEDH